MGKHSGQQTAVRRGDSFLEFRLGDHARPSTEAYLAEEVARIALAGEAREELITKLLLYGVPSSDELDYAVGAHEAAIASQALDEREKLGPSAEELVEQIERGEFPPELLFVHHPDLVSLGERVRDLADSARHHRLANMTLDRVRGL